MLDETNGGTMLTDPITRQYSSVLPLPVFDEIFEMAMDFVFLSSE